MNNSTHQMWLLAGKKRAQSKWESKILKRWIKRDSWYVFTAAVCLRVGSPYGSVNFINKRRFGAWWAVTSNANRFLSERKTGN